MTDDDLRDKLTQAAMDGLGIYATEGHRITMALLPVVREALADAWDDGAELGYEWNLGVIPKPSNPWREGN